eukprot:3940491-Rhodomonas_salina.4
MHVSCTAASHFPNLCLGARLNRSSSSALAHIECHGQIGLSPDMDNTEGANNNYDPAKDYAMCKTGTPLHNGSTVYVKLENWKVRHHSSRL